MNFVKSEGTNELEVALTKSIKDALNKNESVLWLVPGGSNILVAIRVMNSLPADKLHNLTVALTDERFGPPGHPDSNFFQLHQKGFTERGATFVDLLGGRTFEETVEAGNTAMKQAFEKTVKIIGFFGIGADGHTAGILPGSPAAVSDKKWMIGYDGGQFMRFTLTPFALSHVKQAFVGAFGEDKKPALTTLRDSTLPIVEQPSQLLKSLPESYIYTYQIGENS